MRPGSIILPRALRTGAVCAAMTAFTAAPAAAKGPPVRACTAAFNDAQERARSGHLREAKELFLKCATTACGGLQRRCASAADQTSADMPRVALVVNDSAGTPLVDVLVKMDGQPLVTRLDGRAIAFDPGVHEFTFGARVGEAGRYVWMTRKLMVAQGQREPILVALPPPPDLDTTTTTSASAAESAAEGVSTDAPASDAHASTVAEPSPASPTRSRASALPWVVGGAGALAVGAGALLTFWGNADNAALAQCSPDCKPSSVDHIHQLYLAADVSFAVGGAAVGLTALLLATSHHKEGAPKIASSGGAAYVFGLQPIPSGGLASFGGKF